MGKKKQKKSVSEKALAADAAALAAVEPYRHSPPVEALSWYSELGDQPQMLSLSGGLLALGLVRGDRRMMRAGGRMVAAHLVATWAKNFIKRRIDRTRPRNAAGPDGHRPRPGRNESKAETSFPSGHSAGAVAVARAFAREYPEQSAPAYGAAGLIALAQIPRCAHYPTDVGAGIAIGLAAEALVAKVWPAPALAEAAGEELVGAQTRGMVEDLRYDHQLVGAGALDESLDGRPDRRR